MYCSRDCQVAHWSDHKPFCRTTTESIKERIARGDTDYLRKVYDKLKLPRTNLLASFFIKIFRGGKYKTHFAILDLRYGSDGKLTMTAQEGREAYVLIPRQGPLNYGDMNGMVSGTRAQISQVTASLPPNLKDFPMSFCVYMVQDDATMLGRQIFAPFGLEVGDASHTPVAASLDDVADLIEPVDVLVDKINNVRSCHNPRDDTL